MEIRLRVLLCSHPTDYSAVLCVFNHQIKSINQSNWSLTLSGDTTTSRTLKNTNVGGAVAAEI